MTDINCNPTVVAGAPFRHLIQRSYPDLFVKSPGGENVVKLNVRSGGIVRRLVVVGGHIQGILGQVLWYGVGTAAGRELGSQVIQPKGLESEL